MFFLTFFLLKSLGRPHGFISPLEGRPPGLQSWKEQVKILETKINLQQSGRKEVYVQRQITTELCLASWQNLREKRERSNKPQMINKDGDS